MNGFCIQTFLKIVGISAASGITYTDGVIRIVSDNSNYLYEYPVSTGQLNRLLLKDGQQTEQVAKAQKMDLEAVVDRDDALYFWVGLHSLP